MDVCKTVCWWCEFSDIDSVLFPTYIECKTPIFLLHSYPNTLVFCDWVTLVFVLGHSTMPKLQRYIQNMNTTLCKTVHERSNIWSVFYVIENTLDHSSQITMATLVFMLLCKCLCVYVCVCVCALVRERERRMQRCVVSSFAHYDFILCEDNQTR